MHQETVGLDDGRSARDDSNEVVAIEVSLLPPLPDLPVGWVPHHHRLVHLLAIPLYVVHHSLLGLMRRVLLPFAQRLLHVACQVVRYKLYEGLQFGEDLDTPAAVEEGRLDDPQVLAFLIEEDL